MSSSPYARRPPGGRPGGPGRPGRPGWGGPPAQPQPATAIDRTLTRLRDRWETDPAYRSRVSVVGGGAALISLCLLVAIVAVIANSAFGAGPSGTSGAGSTGGGGGPLQGFTTYPTPSLPPWTPGTVPNAAPVPPSQTPIPKPTRATTPTVNANDGTPTPTGGGFPQTCNGRVGGATWTILPCPQQAGQGGSISISAPKYGNEPINVLISFGVCAGNANCTYTFLPSQYHLDGNGDITLSYTVPAAAANNSAPVSGMVNIQNGPSFSFTAAPVQ